MDAKISIPHSINKLQHLLDDDETTTKNPRLKQQVQKVIDNLHAAKQLLKDVDDFAESPSDGSENNRVRLLRAVHSVEDAVDTFLVTQEYQRRRKEENEDRKRRSSSSLTKKLCSCSCYYGCKSFCSLIRFTKKMKKFNDVVRRFAQKQGGGTNSDMESNNNNNTGLLSFQNDRDRLSRRQRWDRISSFRLEEESHVVGDLQRRINDLVLRLIPQLNQQSFDDLSAQVIVVVGEEGSGKTTLARTVYNRSDVKRHFTRRAWVRIPSVFNARDVLVDMLEQVNPAELLVDATLTEAALMWRLTKLLFGTRFLIVLDDVNTPGIWESLPFDFFHSQGGRIIITTRNTDSLPPDVAYSTLNVCRLNEEESWSLFLKKVGIAEDELNNRKVIEIKEKVLNICAGLPSAIVLLGGLLSTKDGSGDEWSRVLMMLENKSSEDIMALSYQDLPFEVKPCFLHMGLFPRGFDIPVRRLIQLWCAEDFMTLSSEIDPENLAELCLEELVKRNMVQVTWRVDGTPKTCCMPNDLYDFFSSKAANVGFLDHHFWSSHASQKQHKFAVRRLAAYMRMINYFSSPLDHVENLRSYLAFDTRILITPVSDIYMLLNKIFSNRGFGLLRVLDLEGVFKPKLSDNVFRKLFLLRYLGLRSTFVDDIPNISQLAYLESLDVKHTNIRSLDLSSFTKLQHVCLNRNYIRTIFPIDSTNLLTLWGASIYEYNFDPFGAFFSMNKLTKLGLTLCTKIQTLKGITAHIHQLNELQSLKLRSIDRDGKASTIVLQSLAVHKKLENVYLLGNLQQSVIDVGFLPPNLRKLTLSLSGLDEDPMLVLGQLPHLNILRLFYASYTGELMTCKGFPRLRQLKLWKLQARVWSVEEGAMPCLRELEIRSCDQLELPQGLQNVTSLKDLVLTNMSMDFVTAVEECLKNRDLCITNNTWNSLPFP